MEFVRFVCALLVVAGGAICLMAVLREYDRGDRVEYGGQPFFQAPWRVARFTERGKALMRVGYPMFVVGALGAFVLPMFLG